LDYGGETKEVKLTTGRNERGEEKGPGNWKEYSVSGKKIPKCFYISIATPLILITFGRPTQFSE